uniref:Uncharacterized protein n=2 Tax=Thermoproteati TaxID=1783275 RepID=H5SGE5_9CREN|nr:hypothetical protein HGMM_F29F10C45 [Candidatus Caldarchaeum subterraneum]BAL55231.1 hypothetical protein HGMM_F25A04C17 [uncultured crenarchaeote]
MGLWAFFREVWGDARARAAGAGAGLAYAVAYLFLVGIVFPLSFTLPPSFPIPSYEVVEGQFPQFPILTIYISRGWALSINPEAFITLTVLTLLVSLNTAALIYLNRHGVCSLGKRLPASYAALLPSLFTFFSCCGGGVVSTLLLSTGAGLSALVFLQDYGRIFTLISAAMLTGNLVLLKRSYRSISS